MNSSSSSQYYFTIADYAVFVGMLMVSSGIGLYFAFKNRKNHSNTEFLTANKSLGMFPVAMSLLASFQSSVTILGYPAEMFYRGTQFWMVCISSLVAATLAAELFLPVFYKLNFTSVNKYLEERFGSSRVRLAVSASFLLCTVPYMGVVLYGPSLALETVTGLSVSASIFIIGGICTLYTSIGGIKAVIWTDVVQVFLMFAGLLVVMIRGFYLSGGVDKAFEVAARDNRIQFFNFNIDIYSTTTLWNTVIGMGTMWSGNYATSQTEVQRYCNVSTERRAKMALYLNFVGVALLISCACLCGIALYGYYALCDPLKAGEILKTDQLMPYFVMRELQHLPGLAGLFVSCVFSASLSTMSSGFNALATVTYDDFLSQTQFIQKMPEKRVKMISRGVAFGYGALAILMAFVVSQINSILEAAISIAGALVGPMFGLFLLGVLCPFANSFGVLCGLFTGEVFGIWLLIGSLIYPKKPQMLPTSIDQCPIDTFFTGSNSTTFSSLISSNPSITPLIEDPDRTGMLKLYHVAYLLVPVFGCLISLTIGLIASLLSGGCKTARKVRPQYLSKWAWLLWPADLLPEKCSTAERVEYGSTRFNNGYSAGGLTVDAKEVEKPTNGEANNNNNNVVAKIGDLKKKHSIDSGPKLIDSTSFITNGTNGTTNGTTNGQTHSGQTHHNPISNGKKSQLSDMKRSRIIKQNAFDIDDQDAGSGFDDEKTRILAYRAYSPESSYQSSSVTPSPQPPTAATNGVITTSSASTTTLSSEARTTPTSSSGASSISNSAAHTPEINRRLN